MGPRRANQLSSTLVFLFSLPFSFQLEVPSTLPGQWQYQGCWTDVGRTIGSAQTADDAMTNEKCIAFCDARGFSYAGTEWYNECYCGGKLATKSAKAADADCSTACAGDSTQACGGGNRLSLFYTPDHKEPQPNTGIPDWPYIGCYSEGTTGRALTHGAGLDGSKMTGWACTAACKKQGFVLAGTEYSGECYCGNSIQNGGALANDGCNMACNGNRSEICGGPGRLNVYDYKMMFSNAPSSTTTPKPPTTSAPPDTTSAAPTPAAPSQPAAVGDYVFYGCRTEASNTRALSMYTYADDTMTLESCQAFCSAKGTAYFGTEYGRECYCGNKLEAGSVAAPATDCSMTCAANKWEYCGNGNRLSVYGKDRTGGSDGSTTTSAAATTSTTSAATPVGTGFPAGWSSQGCWVDGPNGRIMPTYQAPDSQTLTPQSCAALCNERGYIISGTEYHAQCFCSNAIYNGGARADDQTRCNTPCSGDSKQMCGGPGHLSVVSNGPPRIYSPPTAQIGGLNDTWTYAGCYEDNVNNVRSLPWALHFPDVMTPAMCLGRCGQFGYAAAGLEYGEECYCGDFPNIAAAGATKRPETECNIVCAGNASAICGGGSRLSTYVWSGPEPLYSWSFPEDKYGAGTYSNLVGGVVIPLMTMQSITGKVSFLEKWGTGPPNSTGAYELDLSQVDNFENAWRTMHVKTDLFCAAGVTLPDKAGRQLTVGGWSLDSTYGVRLYWPDGSDGVKGKNDWQENVNELSLKVGRWYPTAMIMANGSVLIVGGEVGSNAAAEPTLEILPDTGTAPLYMDWLERTDPNNLYPYLAVLPGGGIFVAYWNEARILDEVTFDTTLTLPNIPGAVNDDYGGRTYPLEGTAVLLPQHAPYTDPLGILMCGGSTEGHEALDNCAFIHPEAPDPHWTLERMPSKRVMSCMAPLPDGTYLIANGAHEGVAGFGLATSPNLNAVLYDPAKEVGSRMSVMANTSVARLYHSEAITLLDGRVLITGSDPQDGVNPQEMRVEVFTPPYLLTGRPRPTFSVAATDWAYGETVSFRLGAPARAGGPVRVSLLGAVSSTHGNSMGARTLFPATHCYGNGTACSVVAPPDAHVAPPGWYQMFVLDGPVPAVGVYVRIGGDPARLGDWPPYDDFDKPGV